MTIIKNRLQKYRLTEAERPPGAVFLLYIQSDVLFNMFRFCFILEVIFQALFIVTPL
jgi:hypothetical protein